MDPPKPDTPTKMPDSVKEKLEKRLEGITAEKKEKPKESLKEVQLDFNIDKSKISDKPDEKISEKKSEKRKKREKKEEVIIHGPRSKPPNKVQKAVSGDTLSQILASESESEGKDSTKKLPLNEIALQINECLCKF